MARIRPRVLLIGAGLALVAALLTFGSAGFGGDKETSARYCWGSWGSKDDQFRSDDDVSYSAEDTPPSRKRPHGTCTVTRSWKKEKESLDVRYGTLPKDTAEKRRWADELLGPKGTPLPDGLSGYVDDAYALLVLPRSCDIQGRPSTVLMESGDGEAMFTSEGWQSARLLVAAANSGMKRAGCAPQTPLRLRSPLPSYNTTTDRDTSPGLDGIESYPDRLCGVAGLGPDSLTTAPDHTLSVPQTPGRRTTLACDARAHKSGEPVLGLRAVRDPRLVALFAGLPERDGERGSWALSRSRCGDARMVTYVRGDRSAGQHVGDPSGALPRYERAAAAYFGCEGKRG
ncbi:hypothetical protein [Streptomyces sp. NBC_01187]|uniref:hypothetical protein n=1 Tax=Streptomyces sp. NBC_01187 TaxID=2903766 RepID=UPI00386BCEF2|nr:hypothetical protein OG220_18360 [Streptomyces sp. NBC_01187]